MKKVSLLAACLPPELPVMQIVQQQVQDDGSIDYAGHAFPVWGPRNYMQRYGVDFQEALDIVLWEPYIAGPNEEVPEDQVRTRIQEVKAQLDGGSLDREEARAILTQMGPSMFDTTAAAEPREYIAGRCKVALQPEPPRIGSEE